MVVLQWYPEVKSAGNSTDTTYSMLFCQPRVGTPSLPPDATHIICVLDTSGSMMGNRLSMLQDTMTRLISVLEETGHAFWLSVITFSSTATILVPPGSLTATEHRRVLRQAISRLRAGGQTNMEDAFKAVNTVYDDAKQEYSTMHDTNRLSTVCLFMTDGYCTRGECMPRDLIGMLQPDVALHSVGIGKDHDSHLLELLSYGSAYYSIPTANLIPDSVGQYMGEVCDVVHVGVMLDHQLIEPQMSHHLCEPDRGFFQYVEGVCDSDSDTAREEQQPSSSNTFCIPQLSHDKPFVLVWKNLPNNDIDRITSCVMDSSHHSSYCCYTTTPDTWKAEDHIQTQAHLHRKLFLDMLAHVKTQDLSPCVALPHLETILTQWESSMAECKQTYPEVYETHAPMVNTMFEIARNTLEAFRTVGGDHQASTTANTPPRTPPRSRHVTQYGRDPTPFLTSAIHSQNSMYGFTPHYTAFQDDPGVNDDGEAYMMSPGLPSNPPSLSRYVSANTQQYMSLMTPHR